jgi:hypothetical protein
MTFIRRSAIAVGFLVPLLSAVPAYASSSHGGASLEHHAAPVSKTLPAGSTGQSVIATWRGNVDVSLTRTPDGIAPNTSGRSCEGRVCMKIFGKRHHVSKWHMDVLLHPGDCTQGIFWGPPNKVLFDNTRYTCNESDISLYYNANLNNLTFTHDITLCNTAFGFGGKPCNRVHS